MSKRLPFDAMTVSYGAEWREESFEVKPGDQLHLKSAPLGFDPVTGTSQGFGIGSNGFPGFQPRAAGVFSRNSKAAYLDIEAYLTDQWMLELCSTLRRLYRFW